MICILQLSENELSGTCAARSLKEASPYCSTLQVSKEAAEAATAAKGSYGTGIGEEWNAWLPVAWGIRELADAMDASGQPAPNAVTQRPDGQWVVDAFPLG